MQAIEGLHKAEACSKYMFVETYADWADHGKTLKTGAARQARQVLPCFEILQRSRANDVRQSTPSVCCYGNGGSITSPWLV